MIVVPCNRRNDGMTTTIACTKQNKWEVVLVKWQQVGQLYRSLVDNKTLFLLTNLICKDMKDYHGQMAVNLPDYVRLFVQLPSDTTWINLHVC